MLVKPSSIIVYGVDLDKNMVSLATLNMLLNGDGEAKLYAKSDKGSILAKIADCSPPALVDLIPSEHARGQWDVWPDKTKLKKLGLDIKKLREAKGLSFRELSYACDIDNSKISKIEKGQINITFTTILQLAKALEVNPSELLQTEFD